MFSYYWLFIIQCVLQNRKSMHVAGIPESHGDIAQVAASPGPLNGTQLKALIEFLF